MALHKCNKNNAHKKKIEKNKKLQTTILRKDLW